nr:cyclic nucleotide-binding domain-containing protein [uncultured Marinobacter sp.]
MREMDALAYWQEKGSAYFRELSTFGAIPDKVIRRLLEKGRVIRLDTGECLYSVGERSEAFYIVLSGTVSTWMPRQDGERPSPAVMNQGTIWALSRWSRSWTGRSLSA